MGFLDYYKACWHKYADFQGRARRSEYWYFALGNFLVGIVLGILDAALFGSHGSTGPLGLIYCLAALVPSLAVSVRRLHDTDKSGWFLLLGLIPLIGPIILLVFFATMGTSGSNRFGSDPIRA